MTLSYTEKLDSNHGNMVGNIKVFLLVLKHSHTHTHTQIKSNNNI